MRDIFQIQITLHYGYLVVFDTIKAVHKKHMHVAHAPIHLGNNMYLRMKICDKTNNTAK